MWDDTVKGGMWTRSIEESYEKGSNQGKRDLAIAELLLSRGAASAYKQGVKKAIDLPDGDAQRGKRDGGNRTGLLLDGVDNNRNSSASLKGGKLKTQAKSFPKSIEELQEMVDKLLKQMGNVLGGVAVFREAYSGEYRFYFVRHDDLSGNGGGGGGNHRRSDSGNEGTGESNSGDRVPDMDLHFQQAVKARDEILTEIATWSKTKIRDVATVVGGVNIKTGKVAVGVKSSKNNYGVCAEDLVVEQLGGYENIKDIVMTPAIRPRTGDVIPVCLICQTKFMRENFIPGTTFD
ncbi:hypothetical protein [Brevibacillus sp. HB1.3]|uniref:hypothetical protein n=1 Tax=Brevibacillus sp. HB1.3 TaxID=2738842 RepID=UPI0020A61E9F|nr:hypothetical protein [Brevibacillus sp. HB1.3]